LCSGLYNWVLNSTKMWSWDMQNPLKYIILMGMWLVYKNTNLSAVRLAGPTTESSCLQKQCSTQSTAHSHSTIKCNLSVTITKKFSLKMTQQGQNM
jgi:hypothetical protein